MEIVVSDNKLRRNLADQAARTRAYGQAMAEKLRLRLASLAAADSLATFWPPKSGPERCHELIGDRAGQFSIDLKQPYRLIFEPGADIPERAKEMEEQAYWATIATIEIKSIEDTHG